METMKIIIMKIIVTPLLQVRLGPRQNVFKKEIKCENYNRIAEQYVFT